MLSNPDPVLMLVCFSLRILGYKEYTIKYRLQEAYIIKQSVYMIIIQNSDTLSELSPSNWAFRFGNNGCFVFVGVSEG